MYHKDMSLIDDLRKNRDDAREAEAKAKQAESDRVDAQSAYDKNISNFIDLYRQYAKDNKNAKFGNATDDELRNRIDDLVYQSGIADEKFSKDEKGSKTYYDYGSEFIKNIKNTGNGGFKGITNKFKNAAEAGKKIYENLSDEDKDALNEANKLAENYKKYRNGEIQSWEIGIDQDKARKGLELRAQAQKAITEYSKSKSAKDATADFMDIFDNYEEYGKDAIQQDKVPEGDKKSDNSGDSSDTVSFTLTRGNDPNYKGFGQKLVDLGLATENGLWGENGDVAYYTKQLNDQGIYGNLPIGKKITLKRRK